MQNRTIQVTSHVARDFLQNAAYFNTTPKLVWEYVANSLDAAKDDGFVRVAVEITSDCATIADNGRGMSWQELGIFFQVHGENPHKKRGRRVRGRFGTGKCAAFGLANYLRIDTVQGGLRNVVELRRRDIEAAKGGEPFPVCSLVVDEPTDEEDGTVVEVREFNIKRPNIPLVITYIERHLGRYRQRAHVTVNGHECKFKEPPFIEQFERLPPPEVVEHIGQVPLFIKVSPVPLDDGFRGIDILSHGIWHGTSLAGLEKRERASYLFGYIDVPILEDGEWPIPAFDNTRNNTLNPQNPVVAALLEWLYEELEQVREYIVEKERERRKSETVQQLSKEARKISRVLNDDFAQHELELKLARRVARRYRDKSTSPIPRGSHRLDSLEKSQAEPQRAEESEPKAEFQARLRELTGLELVAREGASAWELIEVGPCAEGGGGEWEVLESGECLEETGSTRRALTPTRRKTQSKKGKASRAKLVDPEPVKDEPPPQKRQPVFRIDFEGATAASPRSRYDSDTKTIFINLDHPQIASAFEAGGRRIDSHQFLAMCYEVIVIEYALAVPLEKLQKGELTDPGDALFDVRDTINRVVRRFMPLLNPD